MATEAGLMADSFQFFGMKLNFAAAKTAALIAVRGPGAKQTRVSLFAKSFLPVLREHTHAEELPLATHYRQLGVIHSPDGSIRSEIQQRIGDAWTSFRQGCKKIFRNSAISTPTRFSLLRGLVLSRLFYAAGSWPSLRVGESRMLQAAVVSMLRQTAGPNMDKRCTCTCANSAPERVLPPLW